MFHECISVRKHPKTKTKVASIPDDTIVLHRILTSLGRREGEVKVGGRGGGRWREKGKEEEGERRTGGGTRGGGSGERMGEEMKGEGEEDKMGVKLREGTDGVPHSVSESADHMTYLTESVSESADHMTYLTESVRGSTDHVLPHKMCQ